MRISTHTLGVLPPYLLSVSGREVRVVLDPSKDSDETVRRVGQLLCYRHLSASHAAIVNLDHESEKSRDHTDDPNSSQGEHRLKLAVHNLDCERDLRARWSQCQSSVSYCKDCTAALHLPAR